MRKKMNSLITSRKLVKPLYKYLKGAQCVYNIKTFKFYLDDKQKVVLY